MTEKLRRAGLRPIHPAVDVTNFVMLELGQPLHAYDMNLVTGPIRPRMAEQGEKVALLDGKEIEANSDTLVISDDSGAIGIGGIMGGLGTAVTEQTTDIFLEAAFFTQDVIAGRARSYGMHTDASLRFELGVDPGERPTGKPVDEDDATRCPVGQPPGGAGRGGVERDAPDAPHRCRGPGNRTGEARLVLPGGHQGVDPGGRAQVQGGHRPVCFLIIRRRVYNGCR